MAELSSKFSSSIENLIESQIFHIFNYVEFAHAFSCAYIELWMHAGSLESTKDA